MRPETNPCGREPFRGCCKLTQHLPHPSRASTSLGHSRNNGVMSIQFEGWHDPSGKGDHSLRTARDGVAPDGSDRANSGHHHLLIDTELPPLDQPIPNDFNHLHFGAGQTEAEITLKPGTHTLQLLLGDKDHIPHNPPVMSPRIRVAVTEEGTAPREAASQAPTRRTQNTRKRNRYSRRSRSY